jgi:flagella basal body P-ring formation protein FlgA
MRVLVALGVVLACAVVRAQDGITPQQAIVTAVVERLGIEGAVEVRDLETAVVPEPGLMAEPDLAARVAKRSRFVLSAGGHRRGLAVAVVTVRAAHPRAARAIARDEAIGPDAVDLSVGELPAIQMRPLLDAKEIVGLTARRAIAPGEVFTAAVLRVTPLIRSGDEVEATIRIGRVRVTGAGIASGSGQVGDMIRITQPHSSRLLRARITGPGAVEIVE